ncbi:MAG: FHA domain-containing protein [Nannocystaceae bacterium]
MRWGGGRTTRILGASELRIGRAPDAGLSLPQASLSREHVALRLDASGERTEVVALDLGSKIGSFWDGEPLRAGEPQTIAHSGELALGTAAAVRVTPLRSKDGHAHGAVIEGGADARPLVWLPQGGPLWLDASIAVPARVLFERGHVAIDFRAGVRVDLDGHALEPGACIELLLGDRIALHGAPLVLEVLG